MRKRKTKVPEAVFIACGLSEDLRNSLKALSARRKAHKGSDGKPAFINGIVEEAIAKLATLLKSDAEVSFIPVPRNNEGRTTFRISPAAHRVALKASENADVILSDFVRTAISLYIRSHVREINQKAKTAADRVRKPARR